jgi:hypothetical protein
MVMPDSAVYRCIGHAYHGVGCLGKLTEGGWDIMLKEPAGCQTLLCTICDQCRGNQAPTPSKMTNE